MCVTLSPQLQVWIVFSHETGQKPHASSDVVIHMVSVLADVPQQVFYKVSVGTDVLKLNDQVNDKKFWKMEMNDSNLTYRAQRWVCSSET